MNEKKRQRAGWTDERREKFRATKARNIAENKAKHGSSYTPEGLAKRRASYAKTAIERKDSSMARGYLPILQHFLLSLLRAMDDEAVFDALSAEHPELEIRWDRPRKHILFTFSTNTLRPEFGALAEQMFRKLFECVQPGGFSTTAQKGYKSVWRLNMDALSIWLIASQRKNFTVSAAVNALLDVTENRRAATRYEVVNSSDGSGLKEVVGRDKKMQTPADRKAVLATRRELLAAVKEHNAQTMSDWRKSLRPCESESNDRK